MFLSNVSELPRISLSAVILQRLVVVVQMTLCHNSDVGICIYCEISKQHQTKDPDIDHKLKLTSEL